MQSIGDWSLRSRFRCWHIFDSDENFLKTVWVPLSVSKSELRKELIEDYGFSSGINVVSQN